ncbi:MAG: transcription termination factor Rho [Clostridia bacterium]|nr:transcription termination factor Rho [Clostridia bacterium]
MGNLNYSETLDVPGVKKGFFSKSQVEDRAAPVSGVLELHSDGYGFLRAKNYEASANGDTFVSRQAVKANWLRRGDFVVGYAERTRETGSSSLTEILSVNGMPARTPRRNFDELVPCYPDARITLEHEKDDLTLRMMDILCPLGKGQRGLIVAPPKTGKTTLLKRVAQAIGANYPDIHLIVLLIDERPEEVTDLTRCVNGEVVFSTFDEPAEHHIRAAELVMWRAKRLVELGRDVVILLDSITRLTRAYNQALPASGKILSGGIDPIALQAPKKFFGGARNIENGGSLTILATALVETGSKMDDVIYEEFKGTGNMEIHLTRELAERRIFPAIDLYGSGTRKDELLLTPKELECAYLVRRFLKNDDGVERLLDMFARTDTNDEFVNKVPAWLKLMNM